MPPKAPEVQAAIARTHDTRYWNRFVEEYLIDYNAGAAYARAFAAPRSMKQTECTKQGNKLLDEPLIAEEIARRSEARLTLASVTIERVTLELARVAFSDIGDAVHKTTITGVDGTRIDVEVPREIADIPEDTRRAVQAITFTKQGATIKMGDKQAALETLAKMLLVANGQSPTGGPRAQRVLNGVQAPDHDAVTEDEITLMLAEAEAIEGEIVEDDDT